MSNQIPDSQARPTIRAGLRAFLPNLMRLAVVAAAWLGIAVPPAAGTLCEGSIAVDFPGLTEPVPAGGTAIVRITVGTGAIPEEAVLGISKVVYDLGCQNNKSCTTDPYGPECTTDTDCSNGAACTLRLPNTCRDPGDDFDYDGDAQIESDCPGITWTSNLPNGGSTPNAITFSPNVPLVVPGDTSSYCSLQFQVRRTGSPLPDLTPDMQEVRAYLEDATCSTGGSASPVTVATIPVASTPGISPTATPTRTGTPTRTATLAATPSPTHSTTPTATVPFGTLQQFIVTTHTNAPDVQIDGICDVGNGLCSLRAAIQEANATGAPDVIRFAVDSVSVCHPPNIQPLPVITQPVTITGTIAGPTGKVLIASNCDATTIGLDVAGGNSTIGYVRLANFGVGINLRSSNNNLRNIILGPTESQHLYEAGIRVHGNNNRIGVDGSLEIPWVRPFIHAPSSAYSNAIEILGGSANQISNTLIGNGFSESGAIEGNGILIRNGHQNVIHRNVIASVWARDDEHGHGIVLTDGSSFNEIRNNSLGADEDDEEGLITAGIQGSAILLQASPANSIGPNNFIDQIHALSNNAYGGIVLLDGSHNNQVWLNFIGSHRYDIQTHGVYRNAIYVRDSSGNEISRMNIIDNIYADVLTPENPHTSGSGITLSGTTSWTALYDNYIGLNADLNDSVGGIAGHAINIIDSANVNWIGTHPEGEHGNMIGLTYGDGIRISGMAFNNYVIGNQIRMESSYPTGHRVHGYGIAIDSSGGNAIGDPHIPGAQNRIENCGKGGIQISGGTAGNSIRGNSIVLARDSLSSFLARQSLYPIGSLRFGIGQTLGGISGIQSIASESETPHSGILLSDTSNNYIGSPFHGPATNVILVPSGADGSTRYGIALLSGSSNNIIAANSIGASENPDDLFGEFPGVGIYLQNADDNQIGPNNVIDNIVDGDAGLGHGIVAVDGSSNNAIIRNFLGINATETDTEGGLRGHGIWLNDGSHANTIGAAEDAISARNSIANVFGDGVRISNGSDENRVFGNNFGFLVPSEDEHGVRGYGVAIHGSSKNIVGGALDGGSRNLFYNCGKGAVEIVGQTANNNIIGSSRISQREGTGIRIHNASNNYIGDILNLTGNVIQVDGSQVAGIRVTGSSSGNRILGNRIQNPSPDVYVQTLGIVIDTTPLSEDPSLGIQGTRVGERFSGRGNIVLGCAIGLNINGHSHVLQGNFVGYDPSNGAFDPIQGNGTGIAVSGERHQVGTLPTIHSDPDDFHGNVVVASMGNGIEVRSRSTELYNNLIGMRDAYHCAGNAGHGIFLPFQAHPGFYSFTRIGDALRDDGMNVIACNDGDGVRVQTRGNRIGRNRIFDNQGLGIDLNGDGVTSNDALDADLLVGNLGQNFPMLGEAIWNGATTTVTGTLHSAPNTTFTVEVYESPTHGCDESGHGEGDLFVEQVEVHTDSSGDAAFTISVPRRLDFVAAVATDIAANTSEFSNCVEVSDGDVTPSPVATATPVPTATATPVPPVPSPTPFPTEVSTPAMTASPLPTGTPTATPPPTASASPTPDPCTCIGDADRNGTVNVMDYASVRSQFGWIPDPSSLDGDADCNGIVNVFDYAAVRHNFGRACPARD